MDDIVNLNLLEYTPVITGYNSIRCNLDLNLNLIYSYNTLYLKLKSLLIPLSLTPQTSINENTPSFPPYILLRIKSNKE